MITRKEGFCYKSQSTEKRITEQLGIGKDTVDKCNDSINSKKQKLASDPWLKWDLNYNCDCL